MWRGLRRTAVDLFGLPYGEKHRGFWVAGSSSLRQPPGRWQFRWVLPGWQLAAELANEKRFIFPGTLLHTFRLLEYLVTL